MDFDEMDEVSNRGDAEGQARGARAIWHLASFVLPALSLRFYRIALRKQLSNALAFFVLFATVLSALFTLRFVRILSGFDAEVKGAVESGEFPVITIRSGVANVEAPQPLILLDEQGQFFALDTSGRYTDIDPDRYREGILLTRTELIVLDRSGQRQSLRLAELNELFDTNPIVIDDNFVLNAWDRFSLIAVILAGISLLVWHLFIRVFVIAFVGLLIWGSVSVLRNQTNYASIMVVGLYAVVPALYLHYLLDRTGLTLPGFQTIILMFIWMFVAIATLARTDFSVEVEEQTLLRMAPIGIPMLLVLAWDVVFTPLIEPFALWVVPLLTFIAWFVLRRFQSEDDLPPAGLG
jgi:hypothetical protein